MLQWGRGLVTAESYRSVVRAVKALTLQWGRGLVTAERRMTVPMLAPMSALQWGRGLVTAERCSPRQTASTGRSGFNGAAVS